MAGISGVMVGGGGSGRVKWLVVDWVELRWRRRLRRRPVPCWRLPSAHPVRAGARPRVLPQEGEVTHFGQKLVGCQAEACWQEVWDSSEYSARREAVAQYNAGTTGRRAAYRGAAPGLCRCRLVLPHARNPLHRHHRPHTTHRSALPPPLTHNNNPCPPHPPSRRSPPLPQARPGHHPHQVWHLLHHQVFEPGGGAGARVHRWAGADVALTWHSPVLVQGLVCLPLPSPPAPLPPPPHAPLPPPHATLASRPATSPRTPPPRARPQTAPCW